MDGPWPPQKNHGRLQWLFLGSGDISVCELQHQPVFFHRQSWKWCMASIAMLNYQTIFVGIEWDNNDHIWMWTAWVGAHQTQALSTMAILHRGKWWWTMQFWGTLLFDTHISMTNWPLSIGDDMGLYYLIIGNAQWIKYWSWICLFLC